MHPPRVNLPPSPLCAHCQINRRSSDICYPYHNPYFRRNLPPGKLAVLFSYQGHVARSQVVRFPSAQNRPSPKAVWGKPFTTLPPTDVSCPLLTSLPRNLLSSLPRHLLSSLPRHCHVIYPIRHADITHLKNQNFPPKKYFCQLKGKKSVFCYVFAYRSPCIKSFRVHSSSSQTIARSEKLRQRVPGPAIQIT